MKKIFFKNWCMALFVIATISTLITFFSSCTGVRLGNSGCKIQANYSYVNNSASGCIVCDSISEHALQLFKKVFPKAQTYWLNMPNQNTGYQQIKVDDRKFF